MLLIEVSGAEPPRPEPRPRPARRGGVASPGRVSDWKEQVRRAALLALVERDIDSYGEVLPMDEREPWAPPWEPVRVSMEFRLPRPKSGPGKTAPWPTMNGRDVDNLSKAVLDALGPWGGRAPLLWEDDAQVVGLMVEKRYRVGDEPWLELTAERVLTGA